MKTAIERFEAKYIPEPNSGCWIWLGAVVNGYGKFGHASRRSSWAHRWSYEYFVGGIPSGLQLDHKCRVRCCVNPAHLEPVSPKENAQRGSNGRLWTHCKRGHEASVDNIRFWKPGNKRICRVCQRENAMKYYYGGHS